MTIANSRQAECLLLSPYTSPCFRYIKYPNEIRLNIFYNPFTTRLFSKEQSLQLYKDYIKLPEIQDKLYLLSGKILGCFCDTSLCHGLALIEEFKSKFNVDISSTEQAKDLEVESLQPNQLTDSLSDLSNCKKRKNQTKIVFKEGHKKKKN